MELKGRALFNLLRISWLDDPSVQVSPWQVQDYRELSTDKIFLALQKLGLVLDEKSFPIYAESCDSPEDLVDCLCLDEEDLERQDQTYLLVFELWRRLLPDKQTLSIFCDELDDLIEKYDRGQIDNEDALQEALEDLEDILDETADLSGSPQKVFKDLALFCAHDLEGFIYDYTSDQIEEENDTYASELVDSFFEFVEDKRSFEFLRARLFARSDVPEGTLLIERLLEQLSEEPDLGLLIEMANFLVTHGDTRLFMQAISQALPLLQTEEQFQQILELITTYYRCLDKEKEEQQFQHLLDNRSGHALDQRFDPNDKDLKQIQEMLIVREPLTE